MANRNKHGLNNFGNWSLIKTRCLSFSAGALYLDYYKWPSLETDEEIFGVFCESYQWLSNPFEFQSHLLVLPGQSPAVFLLQRTYSKQTRFRSKHVIGLPVGILL